MKKIVYVILTAILLTGMLLSTAFAADSVDLKWTVDSANEQVVLTVEIPAKDVGSVEIALAYDAGTLTVSSATMVSGLFDYADVNATIPGEIYIGAMKYAGPYSAGGNICTIVFTYSDSFNADKCEVTYCGLSDMDAVIFGDVEVNNQVVCEHIWNDGVVTDEATCSKTGVMTYTCTICGSTKEASIPTTEHNYVAGTVVAPDCDDAGYTVYTCSGCGDTENRDPVAELGHAPKAAVKENEVEPDCTNPGSYDEVVYCDVCDAEISRTTVPVEALGHTPKAAVKENEVAPGCEVAGSYDNVVYCDVCDAEISRTTVPVDPTGHEWGDWTRVLAPTCSAEGKETRTCKNDATHTQEQAIAINPTAHKWGDWVVTKAPTCSAPGEKEHVCEYNADHKEPGTVPVDPSAHNYIPVVTEPTCTEKGYTTYTCSHDSDHSYVADYVDAKGHTDAPESVMWNWEGYSRATCTTGCGVCGAVTTEKAVIEVGTSTAKDCTEVGKTTYIAKATVNGVEYTDEKTVEGAAGPHDWSDWTVTTKPTCTEKGEETRVCSHNSDHKETRPVDATGHDYEKVVTAPTCTEKGYTTYTCDACGDTYVADYVDALGHDYEAVVTAPTCTEKGYTTYTCAACGDSYIGDYVDELGHNYESVVTEPTCTEQGYTTYTCAACGDSYVDDYVDELGHTEETAATCASGAICDVCGEEYGEKDPANHSEIVEVEEEPSTCTTPGTKAHWECKGCGKLFADANATQEITDLETLKLPLNPDNHTLVYKYDDNNHWLECADGDYSEKDTGSEPHSMGDWHIITNATSSKDGLKEKYCDTCDYTVQEKIPATGTSGSDKDNSDIPDTGDDAPIALMAAVLTVCAAGVVVLTSRKRKNEN